MHLRLAHAVLAVAGLLLVLVLLVLGRDALRVGAPGPRWRRRLVAAGLGLLGALGLAAPLSVLAADPPGVEHAAGLEAHPRWKRLQELAREAEEIAGGARGDYPFSAAQRQELWGRFGAAGGDLGALVVAGVLERAEAELFGQWLQALQGRVARLRTTEAREATCYKPVPVFTRAQEAEAAARRLERRLPLVRELVAAKTLHPRVLAKIVQLVEADRAALAAAPALSADQRRTLDELAAMIARLEQRL